MSPRTKPVALITGASSGIGLELAKIFASEGYDLIISSDNRAKLKKPPDKSPPQLMPRYTLSSQTCQKEVAPRNYTMRPRSSGGASTCW
jgi:NAD(P)-dependent dehydrogenase (short-subunit alcohol dehydrogenase family)